MSMPDAGVSPGRPALSFRDVLILDGTGDWIDSTPAAAGYTGDEIDIEANGTEVEAQSMADADTDFNLSTFECGETVGSQLTVCAASVLPMPAGELLTVVMDLRADVPVASPGSSYVYAVVFDSDADPANDFAPLPGFPRDLFQRTDRWVELIWDHVAASWSVRVTQLDAAGTRVEVASSVRVVRDGSRITFFMARGELPADIPGYRVTAFRHDGMFTQATRGADVSMGTSTLPLLPTGCGFVGAECQNDAGDRGLAGAIACGTAHDCALVILPGMFRGACAPTAAMRCGLGGGSCPAGLTCLSPTDATGYCLDDEQLACMCSTPSGRLVFPGCA